MPIHEMVPNTQSPQRLLELVAGLQNRAQRRRLIFGYNSSAIDSQLAADMEESQNSPWRQQQLQQWQARSTQLQDERVRMTAAAPASSMQPSTTITDGEDKLRRRLLPPYQPKQKQQAENSTCPVTDQLHLQALSRRPTADIGASTAFMGSSYLLPGHVRSMPEGSMVPRTAPAGSTAVAMQSMQDVSKHHMCYQPPQYTSQQQHPLQTPPAQQKYATAVSMQATQDVSTHHMRYQPPQHTSQQHNPLQDTPAQQKHFCAGWLTSCFGCGLGQLRSSLATNSSCPGCTSHSKATLAGPSTHNSSLCAMPEHSKALSRAAVVLSHCHCDIFRHLHAHQWQAR